MSERLVTVAHRAGNDLAGLREALDAGVDLVEADVHGYRGRLEIRHHKTLGPWFLWEQGELVRRTPVPSLADLLAAVGGDPRLMLDLKGIHPYLAGRVAAAVRGTPITVCTQHWWMLPKLADQPEAKLVYSAGSRRGLSRLRRRLKVSPVHGVCVHLRLLTPALVTELRRRADLVLTWPVDDATALDEAHRLGVTGIISKNLPLLTNLP
ncbi:glycerophosphoryl diester phosphodiesterase [Kribbella amoyensis]|uniref:Glycerophosphoryl diester phosphodiesterase n=1 Tax=Kribbella amoyensis TaxID=996641 RepID=A0A561B3L0_9ACTN|nr:glycerophosphodiester phosphodiesterase [Kribbella amoyensis]TWD73449.1 glycerophosphoryl diester phosphodiesterase [Kribbella amoyensis]